MRHGWSTIKGSLYADSHTADTGILHALQTPNLHSALTRSGLAPLLAPDLGEVIEIAIEESSGEVLARKGVRKGDGGGVGVLMWAWVTAPG